MSQLQVELAKLRYELPRAETKVRLSKRSEHPGFMGLGEYEESREKDIKDRIKNIKSKLSKYEDQNARRRSKRKNDGFDMVAIAGYTNAGKSTLLRKLARDHSVNENQKLHNDFDPTAESTNNYFTTLDTVTRRMDFDKRDVLLTDTIGFISDLPNWLVDAFNTTLDNMYSADLVLVVADATEDKNVMLDKISTCYDIISEKNTSRTITVFNKSDKVSESELQNKKQALEAISPNPIAISAKKDQNIDKLKNRIHRALPPFEEDRLLLPMNNESMSLVSWVHNNAYVDKCEYTTSNVIITYKGRNDVVEKIRQRAEDVTR
jgi:GTP-binding protein HflX